MTGYKSRKIQKNFSNRKNEQNRGKQSISEQNRVKYLKNPNRNGIFTDLLKKLLTFACFCSIFYIILLYGKAEVLFRELIPLTTIFSRELKYIQ